MARTGRATMKRRFEVTLAGDDSGKMETAAVELPFDAREAWGRVRTPVIATINGYSWRSTVASMGGCQFVVVNAAARQGAGVRAGDRVTVTLEPDTATRDIEVPPALRKALGAKLAARLQGLSFTHKKEYVLWYQEAKKEETRARRVEKMKEMLSAETTGKSGSPR